MFKFFSFRTAVMFITFVGSTTFLKGYLFTIRE